MTRTRAGTIPRHAAAAASHGRGGWFRRGGGHTQHAAVAV